MTQAEALAGAAIAQGYCDFISAIAGAGLSENAGVADRAPG
jgi:hypothetical protein